MPLLRKAARNGMVRAQSRRAVLATLAGAMGGLAGCQCFGTVDCRGSGRSLGMDVEPLNRVGPDTPAPVDGDQETSTNGTAAPATGTAPTASPTTATATPQRASEGVRWYQPEGEPWRLELAVAEYHVRTDRGTFDGVTVSVYDDAGRELATVEVGPVSVDNGFDHDREVREDGCCPGGEFEQYYGWTETVAVDRFPRHVVASAANCKDDDRLPTSTFEDDSYYGSGYECGETPEPFEE